MSDHNKRAFSRNFMRSRFTLKPREIPEDIFKFSVSSDASTKEDRPMNIDLSSQTKHQIQDETSKVSSNSVKTKVRRVNNPSANVSKPTMAPLKEPLLSKAVSKDNSAIHNVETPRSVVRYGAISVRRLEDNLSEVVSDIDYSTNENVEIKDCYVSLLKLPNLPFEGETRIDVANLSTSKQSAESNTVGNMKHSHISYSANKVSKGDKEQMLEVNQKKKSNKDEPKVTKLKTLKYKRTFPRKKKQPHLNIEFVATPCDSGTVWDVDALYIKSVKQKKKEQEKRRLAVGDKLDEVLLWSGRTSCRNITNLTDLEIAYSVIKNVLDEYSTSDGSTSKFVGKYGKCIEDQVVKKMINVESLQLVSKEIREVELSIQKLVDEPVENSEKRNSIKTAMKRKKRKINKA